MNRRFYLLALIILSIIGSLYAANRTLSEEQGLSGSSEKDTLIKVMLADDLSEITIAGVDIHVSGADIDMDIPSNKNISISYKKGSRWLMLNYGKKDYKKVVSNIIRINSPAGFMRVRSIPFSGRFEIHKTPKGLLLINEVSMERYLIGVLMSEMHPDWEIEAMKALSVAARTYAIKKMAVARKNNAPYDIRASFFDQAYGGGVSINDQKAVKAVHDTAHEVLVTNSGLFDAYYHSQCGGRTELPSNVWGGSSEPDLYSRSVKCPYCEAAPDFIWRYDITSGDLEKLLRHAGYSVSSLKSLHINSLTQTGRIDRMHVVADRGSFFIPAQKLRELLGYTRMKSTNFSIAQKEGLITLIGKGNGHGVGLCQWGAKGMASRGFNYKRILSAYYPAAKIKKYSYEKS